MLDDFVGYGYSDYSIFNLQDWIVSLIYIVASYLILSNYKLLAKFLGKKIIHKDDPEIL